MFLFQCDTNNDGKICIRELYVFISNNRKECTSIPKSIIFKIHSTADKDGDKQLCYEEFVQLIRHRNFQQVMSDHMNA